MAKPVANRYLKLTNKSTKKKGNELENAINSLVICEGDPED